MTTKVVLYEVQLIWTRKQERKRVLHFHFWFRKTSCFIFIYCMHRLITVMLIMKFRSL